MGRKEEKETGGKGEGRKVQVGRKEEKETGGEGKWVERKRSGYVGKKSEKVDLEVMEVGSK